MRWPSAPTRRGPTWRRRCARPGPAAVQRRHPPRRRRLRRAGLQPVGRARLHEPPEPASTWPASRCATSDRAPVGPDRDRRRPLHLQPRAARRVRRRLRDRRRRRGDRRDRRGRRRVEARRPGDPRGGAPRARHDPRRVRARRCTTSSTTGQFVRAVTPRFADVPAVVDKRTVADLADWPYPKQQLVPLVEVVHDRLNVEIFRGCTRGCRFCQAGMITRPVRERPEEQVRTMVRDGPAPHRLRRGRAHVAVERRLLRASTAWSPIS